MKFANFMYWQGFKHGREYATAIEHGDKDMDEADKYRTYLKNATRAERLFFEREFMNAFGTTPDRVIPPEERNRIWDKVKGVQV